MTLFKQALSKGNGEFWGSERLFSKAEPEAIVMDDLDGDGDGDVVVSRNPDFFKGFSVYENTGIGGYRLAYDYVDDEVHGDHMTTGDVDRDGDQDLVMASSDVDILVFYNDGSGVLHDNVKEFDVPHGALWTAQLVDLNGDEWLDLAVTSYVVSVMMNTGDGGFGEADVVAYGNAPLDIVDGDFDNDGDRDLAFVNSSTDDVSILLNDGQGNLKELEAFPTAPEPNQIVGADFDGDGNYDLATGAGDCPEIYVHLGAGNGTFNEAAIYEIESMPSEMTSADVDGDGNMDLVAVAIDLNVLLNDGAGAFPTIEVYATVDGSSTLGMGEANRDGLPDFAVGSHYDDEGIAVILSTGGCVCLGDANGDGVVDPLDSGYILARLGCSVGTGNSDCDAADVNHDGIVDPLDSGYVLARFGTCE